MNSEDNGFFIPNVEIADSNEKDDNNKTKNKNNNNNNNNNNDKDYYNYLTKFRVECPLCGEWIARNRRAINKHRKSICCSKFVLNKMDENGKTKTTQNSIMTAAAPSVFDQFYVHSKPASMSNFYILYFVFFIFLVCI